MFSLITRHTYHRTVALRVTHIVIISVYTKLCVNRPAQLYIAMIAPSSHVRQFFPYPPLVHKVLLIVKFLALVVLLVPSNLPVDRTRHAQVLGARLADIHDGERHCCACCVVCG
jgi:hypothetical protein